MTDVDGRFTVHGLLPGSTRLDVLADGYAPAQHNIEKGPEIGETVDVGVLQLAPGASVLVRVVGLGELASQATVMLEGLGTEYTRGSSPMPLNLRGEVRVLDVNPGRRKWTVRQAGRVPCSGVVELPSRGGEVEIELPRADELSIDVVDSAGADVSEFNARVREVTSQSQRYEAGAPFVVQRSVGLDLSVHIEAEGFVPSERVLVPSHDKQVRIVLERPGRLELEIVGDFKALRAGSLPRNDKRSHALLDIGVSPVPLAEHEITKGSLVLDQLASGDHWVVVQSEGARPQAFGPFEVKSGEVTVGLIEPAPSVYLTGIVRDARSGAPLEGVTIRASESVEADALLFSLVAELSLAEDAEFVTESDGFFRIPAPGEGNTYLSASRDGYVTATIQAEPGDFRAEQIALQLEPVAAITLTVFFTQGELARGATISFQSLADDGEPLHSPRLEAVTDGDGKAAPSIKSGKAYAVAARLEVMGGVRYRVAHRSRLIDNTQDSSLVLVEDPGWLVLPPLVTELRVSGISDQGSSIDIECERREFDAPENLPIPAGEYRVEGLRDAEVVFALLRVDRGVHVPVHWDRGTGRLGIDFEASEWASARFRLISREPAHLGLTRHVALQAEGSSASVEALPHGRYDVTLLDWMGRDGQNHHVGRTIVAVVDANPSRVAFDVSEDRDLRVLLVDVLGASVAGASVRCLFDRAGALSLAVSTSDELGLAEVLIPQGCDGAVLRVVRAGFAPLVHALDLTSKGAELRLRLSSGGQIELSVDSAFPRGELAVQLVPTDLVVSELQRSVLAEVVARVSKRLRGIGPGEHLTLDGVPVGKYLVRASVNEEIVFEQSVAVFEGGSIAVSVNSP
ncbi:MAG: hypothetical protein DHS20C15_24360 [Planctomycetota bacterium]|nr:MAG: hypothetical protein DHS20C15_24360 [Planctomycetota bacterium]